MSEVKYRVIFMPAIEVSKESIELEFSTLIGARQSRDSMAELLIFMADNRMMHNYSNVAWIEELVDGEWEEVNEYL